MKVYFINLDNEHTRRAFQIAQAARLGLDLHRISAVSRDEVTPPSDDVYWQRWQRPLRTAEMGTLLSHRKAWQKVVYTNEPCLILEDDAWLMPSSAKFLADVTSLRGIDHLSLETRNRFKVLGRQHPEFPNIRRLVLDRTGAAAYILWPKGASKLLARTDAVPGLADAVLMETPDLQSWQAEPALAIQIDRAAAYGLIPPIQVASSIVDTVRPQRGPLPFRLRRMRAGLRLFMRLLMILFGAKRRKVPLGDVQTLTLTPAGAAEPGAT